MPDTGTHKRVVLKVWERNGVVCDNASEIDFLEASGWTVQCTEKLSSDGPAGECSVLYVMSPPKALSNNPFPPPTPVILPTVKRQGAATRATIFCSTTRGKILILPLDGGGAAQPVEFTPSPTASYPFASAGFLAVTLDITTPPPKYFALLCINDSAPPDVDQNFPEAPNALVHVEVSFPDLSLVGPSATNPFTALAAGSVPSGLSQVYYLVITN
jgi:hypothetical protein